MKVIHRCKSVEQNGAELVIDYATGLTWQQGGSYKCMAFAAAQEYIAQLNREKFAGYSDWRLPTIDETLSLIEQKSNEHGLRIDPVFDKSQRWIWTADQEASGRAWVVGFYFGFCAYDSVHNGSYVRAVRSGS